MVNFKNNVRILCTLFLLLFTTASAAIHTRVEDPTEVKKKYITYDRIVFYNGQLFVEDEGTIKFVDSLHQDEDGLFMIYCPYGKCPNGHPKGADHGCYWPGCPYED